MPANVCPQCDEHYDDHFIVTESGVAKMLVKDAKNVCIDIFEHNEHDVEADIYFHE